MAIINILSNKIKRFFLNIENIIDVHIHSMCVISDKYSSVSSERPFSMLTTDCFLVIKYILFASFYLPTETFLWQSKEEKSSLNSGLSFKFGMDLIFRKKCQMSSKVMAS